MIYKINDNAFYYDEKRKSLKPLIEPSFFNKEVNDYFEIVFDIFGELIVVECKHDAVIKQLKEFMGVRESDLWKPESYRIRLEWDTLSKFFSRDQPSGNIRLDGIKVNTGCGFFEWRSRKAPFPPTSVGIFSGSFCAFHAASIIGQDGQAVLILGDRGTGKTTLSNLLVNEYGFSLLTDETSFFRNGRDIAESFPRWINLASSDGHEVKKSLYPAHQLYDRISTRPATIGYTLFLVKGSGGRKGIKDIDEHQALKRLSENVLDVGGRKEIVLSTVFSLARNARSAILETNEYKDFGLLADEIYHWLSR